MKEVPLREVIELRNEIVHPRDHPTGQATFVGLEHIEPGTGRRIGSVGIRLEELTGRKARFYPGDIVYGYLRPYLNKVWLADMDGYCSVDQYVFKIRVGADSDYVAAYLRSPQFLERAPIGTTPGQLPRIRTEEVMAVEMPMPSIDEQRRIAARLTAQLASVENTLSKLVQQRTETEALRKATVIAAFDSLGDSQHSSLSTLGWLTDGDWILNADYAPDGVRLLQVGDIGAGILRLRSQRFISSERALELGCTILRGGDVLISRMADPIGRACILPDIGFPAITAVDVAIFRPKPDQLDPHYAVAYMNSPRWYQMVLNEASGATRARISRKNLGSLVIPVPPLGVQREIVSALTMRLAALDRAKESLSLVTQATGAMIPALVREAFSAA